MTLPASGQLSMSDINTELGNTSTAQITLNDTSVRSLLKRTTNASEIGMNAAYGGNILKNLVATGWQYPCYSSDGITWTQGNWPSGLASTAGSPAGSNGPYQWQFAITYGNGKFVAATKGSFPITKIVYSTDGINWTPSNTSPINAQFSAAAFGNGVYVLISSQGGANMVTSTDAVNWTARTVSGGSWDDNCLTFDNGIFLMVDRTNDRVAKSADGINWSTSIMPSRTWSNAAYGNNIWVAVSYAGSPYATSSDNGVTWTARTLPAQIGSGGFAMVTFGNGRFVGIAYGNSGYSLDGITWTMNTSGGTPTGNWYHIRYVAGLKLFIALGSSGSGSRCITSADGINWTARTIPTTPMNGAGPFGLGVGYVTT
jgi:hypothetical protein